MSTLLQAAREVGDHLAFMYAVNNRKYPFRPSPEGERKLAALRDAIAEADKSSKEED